MNRDAYIRLTTLCITTMWLIAQITAVVGYSHYTPTSDSGYYLSLAYDCINAGSAYPLPHHIATDSYIANPGYINMLALCIALFGSSVAGLWMNVVLNCTLLWILFRVVRHTCGNTSSRIFVILFCLLPSNTLIVTSFMSDLPCTVAGTGALLALTFRGRKMIILSAFLIVLSNYIRPVGITFAVTAIVCILVHAHAARRLLWLFGSIALFLGMLAFANRLASGHTFLFSTTGGVNALLGANDTADGGYNPLVLAEGREGDIPDRLGYNVFQKDSLWKARALDWTIAHPYRFTALIPAKLYRQYFCDSYHTSLHEECAVGTLTPEGRMTPSFKRLVLLESIPYYFILLLAAAGLYILCKRGARARNFAAVILTPVFINIILTIATVGATRYHYPAMPSFILLATLAIVIRLHPTRRP